MERIWNKTKGVFRKGQREVMKVSKIGKMKFDCSALQRERQRLLTELGDLVCRLVDEGRLQDDDVTAKVRGIQHLSEQITTAEREMRDLSDGKPTEVPSPADDSNAEH